MFNRQLRFWLCFIIRNPVTELVLRWRSAAVSSGISVPLAELTVLSWACIDGGICIVIEWHASDASWLILLAHAALILKQGHHTEASHVFRMIRNGRSQPLIKRQFPLCKWSNYFDHQFVKEWSMIRKPDIFFCKFPRYTNLAY